MSALQCCAASAAGAAAGWCLRLSAVVCCRLNRAPAPVSCPPFADREHSGRSGEGDTEQEGEGGNEGGGGHAGGQPGGGQGDEHQSFRQGLLRHFHKQSSAANLTRMANPAELRRLQEELRWVGGGGRLAADAGSAPAAVYAFEHASWFAAEVDGETHVAR